MSATPHLERRLGLAQATGIGLAAMVGAGVFAVFAPASAAAGPLLLVALAIAAVVAACNAASTAQLARQYPSAGGAYLFGRERLGEWAGFAAGWSFVVGKTASCAAMALVAASYAVPEPFQRPVAALVVVAVVALQLGGVQRTAGVAMVLVALVLAVLLGVVLSGATTAPAAATDGAVWAGPAGVLQAAGLLFFAFAGYARVATLGEEVRDPSRTIPRAIAIALTVVLAVYAALAVVVPRVLGSAALAESTAPLVDVVRAGPLPAAAPVVVAAAAVASVGALLALLAGVTRTGFAMARHGDLPRPLSAVSARRGTPYRMESAVGALVVLLVLAVDLRTAIGASSFGVLLYYLVANLAALTQTPPWRRIPRAVPVLGAALCVLLCAMLPAESIVIGAGVIGIGLLGRLLVRALR